MKLLATIVACSSLSAASGVVSVQSTVGSPQLESPRPQASGDTGSASLDASLGRPISSLPYTISLPGRYYLTSNLRGVAGQNGITIAATGVTLDLMGFELAGVADSLDGVFVSVPVANLAIHNGTVRNWGRSGIRASSAQDGLYHDLRLSANNNAGLSCGSTSSVFNCTATQNSLNGIATMGNSTISNCTTEANRTGIFSYESVVVVNCTASDNSSNGIEVGTGTIRGCTVRRNNANGISTYSGSTVSECTANENHASGILVSDNSDPFFYSACSTVSGCTASFNSGDGIAVEAACRVVDNTCTNNDTGGNGAGIRVYGSENRIDSNNVTDNGRGISIHDTGNLIIRNSASGNTLNYDIMPNNRYGSILNITGGGTAGVSGNEAMSTVATTDPWANFSF